MIAIKISPSSQIPNTIIKPRDKSAKREFNSQRLEKKKPKCTIRHPYLSTLSFSQELREKYYSLESQNPRDKTENNSHLKSGARIRSYSWKETNQEDQEINYEIRRPDNSFPILLEKKIDFSSNILQTNTYVLIPDNEGYVSIEGKKFFPLDNECKIQFYSEKEVADNLPKKHRSSIHKLLLVIGSINQTSNEINHGVAYINSKYERTLWKLPQDWQIYIQPIKNINRHLLEISFLKQKLFKSKFFRSFALVYLNSLNLGVLEPNHIEHR
ncbi:MAG: hypothetical protein QNJ31_02015 [Candidatus Caenarcaniphilales bacterium]|nr:hypothetical protein [Candidatus Caenarcaniphilales bacterium]